MFKFIIASVLAFVSLAVSAETIPGWHREKSPFENLIIMESHGDQGGVVSLICNRDTGRLNMTYSFKGKQYDFFILRNFGDTDLTKFTGKLIIGTGTIDQPTLFWNVMKNEHAFVIARFPIGSKAKWEASMKDPKSHGPDLDQEGDEYFVAGQYTKMLLNHLGSGCKFDPADNTPIL